VARQRKFTISCKTIAFKTIKQLRKEKLELGDLTLPKGGCRRACNRLFTNLVHAQLRRAKAARIVCEIVWRVRLRSVEKHSLLRFRVQRIGAVQSRSYKENKKIRKRKSKIKVSLLAFPREFPFP
jgi:hypothetical protein